MTSDVNMERAYNTYLRFLRYITAVVAISSWLEHRDGGSEKIAVLPAMIDGVGINMAQWRTGGCCIGHYVWHYILLYHMSVNESNDRVCRAAASRRLSNTANYYIRKLSVNRVSQAQTDKGLTGCQVSCTTIFSLDYNNHNNLVDGNDLL